MRPLKPEPVKEPAVESPAAPSPAPTPEPEAAPSLLPGYRKDERRNRLVREGGGDGPVPPFVYPEEHPEALATVVNAGHFNRLWEFVPQEAAPQDEEPEAPVPDAPVVPAGGTQ